MNDLSAELRMAITFLASFNEEVRGDFSGGVLTGRRGTAILKEQGKFSRK